ncbi:MAG: hypothetical protein JXR68_09385 [Bacteroidales bacterium]|nr:hypothetical protein [Bacteroidales bacterium]
MEARLILRYFFYSVFLFFLQILLFNHVAIGLGLIPFVYILIVLLLPIEIHRVIPLILAFVFGFLVDVFNDTIAFNTAAFVFIAFIRPWILQILSPSDGYEVGKLPSAFNMGFGWFIFYSIIIVFFHQLVYFSLEIFMISKILVVLAKVFVNTLYSVAFIIVLHILFFRNK